MIVHSAGLSPMTVTLDRPDIDPDPRGAILVLARKAFAEKGFEGASMQDLARAAGMSAGNFYRYFPSKAAIIQAFVARETVLIKAHFSQIAAAPDPMAAIHATIRQRLNEETAADCALWAEIVAVAHRQPDIAALMAEVMDTVVGHLTQLFALLKGLDPAEAKRRFGHRANLISLLLRGIEMEFLPGRPANPALVEIVIAEVTRITTEILSEP
jgi:AcrR family transcriptional regulator